MSTYDELSSAAFIAKLLEHKSTAARHAEELIFLTQLREAVSAAFRLGLAGKQWRPHAAALRGLLLTSMHTFAKTAHEEGVVVAILQVLAVLLQAQDVACRIESRLHGMDWVDAAVALGPSAAHCLLRMPDPGELFSVTRIQGLQLDIQTGGHTRAVNILHADPVPAALLYAPPRVLDFASQDNADLLGWMLEQILSSSAAVRSVALTCVSTLLPMARHMESARAGMLKMALVTAAGEPLLGTTALLDVLRVAALELPPVAQLPLYVRYHPEGHMSVSATRFNESYAFVVGVWNQPLPGMVPFYLCKSSLPHQTNFFTAEPPLECDQGLLKFYAYPAAVTADEPASDTHVFHQSTDADGQHIVLAPISLSEARVKGAMCKQGHAMVLSPYTPGDHNSPDYAAGWGCDGCERSSLHAAEGESFSAGRWCCPVPQCNYDLCGPCTQLASALLKTQLDGRVETLVFRAGLRDVTRTSPSPRQLVPEAPALFSDSNMTALLANPAMANLRLVANHDSAATLGNIQLLRLHRAMLERPSTRAMISDCTLRICETDTSPLYTRDFWQHLSQLLGWLMVEKQRLHNLETAVDRPLETLNAVGAMATLVNGVERKGQCVPMPAMYYCGRFVPSTCRGVCGPMDDCPCLDCRDLMEQSNGSLDVQLHLIADIVTHACRVLPSESIGSLTEAYNLMDMLLDLLSVSGTNENQSQRLMAALTQLGAMATTPVMARLRGLTPADLLKPKEEGEGEEPLTTTAGRDVSLNTAQIGARVVRGSSWHYNDQDGGVGRMGTIINMDDGEWVRVRWDSGDSNVYEVPTVSGPSTLAFVESLDPKEAFISNLFTLLRTLCPTTNAPEAEEELLVPVSVAADDFLCQACIGLMDALLSTPPPPGQHEVRVDAIFQQLMTVLQCVLRLVMLSRRSENRSRHLEPLSEARWVSLATHCGNMAQQLCTAVFAESSRHVLTMVGLQLTDPQTVFQVSLDAFLQHPIFQIIKLNDSIFETNVRAAVRKHFCVALLDNLEVDIASTGTVTQHAAVQLDQIQHFVMLYEMAQPGRAQPVAPLFEAFEALLNGQRKQPIQGGERHFQAMRYTEGEVRLLSSFANQIFLFLEQCVATASAQSRAGVVATLQHKLALPPAFLRSTVANILDNRLHMSQNCVKHFLEGLRVLPNRSDQAAAAAKAMVIFIEDVIEAVLSQVEANWNCLGCADRSLTTVALLQAINGSVVKTVLSGGASTVELRALLGTSLQKHLLASDTQQHLCALVADVVSQATLVVTSLWNDAKDEVFPMSLLNAALPIDFVQNTQLVESLQQLSRWTLGLLQLDLPAFAEVVQKAFSDALAKDLDQLPLRVGEYSRCLCAVLAPYVFVLGRIPVLLTFLGRVLAPQVAAHCRGALATHVAMRMAMVTPGMSRFQSQVAMDLSALGTLYLLDEPLSAFFDAPLGLRDIIRGGITDHLLGRDLAYKLSQCDAASVCDIVGTLITAKRMAFAGIERGLGRLFLLFPEPLLVPADAAGRVLYTFRNTSDRHLHVRSGTHLHASLRIGALPPGTVFDIVEQCALDDAVSVYRLAGGGWVGPLEGLVEVHVVEDRGDLVVPVRNAIFVCTGCSLPNYHAGNICVHCAKEQAPPPVEDARESFEQGGQWACSLCTFLNEENVSVCAICNQVRPGCVAEQRGSCGNAACPLREVAPCSNFCPLTGGAVGLAPSCSFCGCLATEHTVLSDVLHASAATATAGRSEVVVHMQNTVSAVRIQHPLQQLFLQASRQLHAFINDNTAHVPFDLARHIVGNVNFFLDALSPDTTAKGDVVEYLTAVAAFSSFVPDQDRLELLLLEGVALRLARGRSKSVELERSLSPAFARLLGVRFSRQLLGMLNDHLWSQRLSRGLVAADPTMARLEILTCSPKVWPQNRFSLGWTPPPEVADLLTCALQLHKSGAFLNGSPFTELLMPQQLVSYMLCIKKRAEPSAAANAVKDQTCWACVRSRVLRAQCICGRDWALQAAGAAKLGTPGQVLQPWRKDVHGIEVTDATISVGAPVRHAHHFDEHGMGTIIGYRMQSGDRVGDLRGIVSKGYVSVDYDDGFHWNSPYADMMIQVQASAVALAEFPDSVEVAAPPPAEKGDEVHVVELDTNATLYAIQAWLQREWGLSQDLALLCNGRHLLDMSKTLSEYAMLGGELCVVTGEPWRQRHKPPLFDYEHSTMRMAIEAGRLRTPGFILKPDCTTLICDPSQGHATLVLLGTDRELVVSTYQMAVLLVFNRADIMTFAQLLATTGLAHFDLERALLALTAPQHPVLKARSKQTQLYTFADKDQFSVNEDWQSAENVCWIRNTHALESTEEAGQRLRSINTQRTTLVDAAIVRLLKGLWVQAQSHHGKQRGSDTVGLEDHDDDFVRRCKKCMLDKPPLCFTKNQWNLKPHVLATCLACKQGLQFDPNMPLPRVKGVTMDCLFQLVREDQASRFLVVKDLVAERVRFLLMEGYIMAFKGDRVAYRPPVSRAELSGKQLAATSDTIESEPPGLGLAVTAANEPGAATILLEDDNKVLANNSAVSGTDGAAKHLRDRDALLDPTVATVPPKEPPLANLVSQSSARLQSVDPSHFERAISTVGQLAPTVGYEGVDAVQAMVLPPFVSLGTLQRELLHQIDLLSSQLSLSRDQALALLQDPCVGWDSRLAVDVYYDEGRAQDFHAQPQGARMCAFLDFACELSEDSPDWEDLIWLSCGHAFHRPCLSNYLQTACLSFAMEGGSKERKVREVLGATCPSLDPATAKMSCREPVPWLTLLADGFFGSKTALVRDTWAVDILNKYVAENLLLQTCPGRCNRVFVSQHLPTNATNVVECHDCKVSFCFKCHGGWDEDHRPATCEQISRWGESIYEFMPSQEGGDDATMLDFMYIYRNTVRCPGCGTRVQKSSGCIHLTCGASAYGRSDWKGKGCGLDFCEVCESPLKESKCRHSECARPEQAEKLKTQRDRLKTVFAEFQEFYLDKKSRAALLDAVTTACRSCRLDEMNHQLLPLVMEFYIKARQVRAYAVVALAMEHENLPSDGFTRASIDLRLDGLRDRCGALEQIMKVVVVPLSTCLRSTILGPIQKCYVEGHSHELTLRGVQRCAECMQDVVCFTPYYRTVELRAACALAILQADELEVDRVMDLKCALAGFLEAFEQHTHVKTVGLADGKAIM